MKFYVNSSVFSKAFAKVLSVTSVKPVLPVVQNVLLKPIGNNEVQLIASDPGCCSAIVTIPVTETENMVPIVLPREELSKYIKCNTGDLDTCIETSGPEDNQIHIFDFMGDFDFVTSFSAAEFPTEKPIENAVTLSIDASRLINAMSLAYSHTGNDDLRPALGGVFLDFLGDVLNIVASDTKSLFLETIKDVAMAEPCKALVNHKASNLIGKLFDTEGNIEISFNKYFIAFRKDNIEFRAALCDLRFPAYNSVIPKNNRVIKFNIKDFIVGTKRASISANTNTNQIVYKYKDGRVEISASDAEYSRSAKTSVNVLSVENIKDDFQISFSSSLVERAARDTGSTSDIYMLVSEQTRPALFKAAIDDDRLILLMPMSISDK